MLPNAGPGLCRASRPGRDAAGIAQAAVAGELTALLPAAHRPAARPAGPRRRGRRRSRRRRPSIAHAGFLTEGLARARDDRLPGRVLRRAGGHGHAPRRAPSAPAPRDRPPGRHARRVAGARDADRSALGDGPRRAHELDGHARDAPRTCPFYAGITLDEIGGRGVRWQEREQAAAHPAGERAPFDARGRRPPRRRPTAACGSARFRSIWASPEVGVAPALKFLHPRQRVELSRRRRGAPRPRAGRPRQRRLERHARQRRRARARGRRARGLGLPGDGDRRRTARARSTARSSR